MRIAKVKTTGTDKEILIPITSLDKPEIPTEILEKWQKIVDLAAKIIGVPSGLLTRLSEDKLEVLLSSNTDSNIFEPQLKLDLGLGWYCENVVGQRDGIVVPDARKSNEWKEGNPSEPFDMISYMGMPIMWPDGEVFGTFCMLDRKENTYSDLFKELMISLREVIQNDLNQILLYQKAQSDLLKKEILLKEIHHRIKNQFNLLISTLNLQSIFERGQKDLNSVLKDIQARISAISQIHDQLYRSINLEELLIVEYLLGLGKHIIRTISPMKIDFYCTGLSIHVSPKTSLSLGIIVNELITNSIKYAFKECELPEIRIAVGMDEEGHLVLLYKDNGTGLPKDFNFEVTNSLGMILIKQSVQQLNGRYKCENNNGFTFEVSFKIK